MTKPKVSESPKAKAEPMSKKKIIKFLLMELAKCFTDDKNEYKKQELLILADSIDTSTDASPLE